MKLTPCTRHKGFIEDCGCPKRELLDVESFLSEAERGILPQRSNDNCTNPYFAECLPLCGTAAKEAHEH